MTYKIRPEFLDLWGEDATEDTILTEQDVEDIARGWEKKPEDLHDQLTVYNYNVAVELMDDEIREELHMEMAPCSEIEFMNEYQKRHLAKYGEEFTY